MKKSQQDYANRKALGIFDDWLDVTGLVGRHSGYYCELTSIIEDAVLIGALVADEVPFKIIDGEIVMEDNPPETDNPYRYRIVPCGSDKKFYMGEAQAIKAGVVDRDGDVFDTDLNVLIPLEEIPPEMTTSIGCGETYEETE